MTTKTFDYYTVVNWKEEQIRARKTKPGTLGPFEVSIPSTLTVDIPDIDVPEISDRLVIPQPTVDRIAKEAVFDEEYPDWVEVAEQVLDTYTDGTPHFLLGHIMAETHGAPDPDDVLAYLEDRA